MQIQRVGVIGAGTMGSGIAQVVAQAGYAVFLQDVAAAALERASAAMERSLDRLVKAGKLTAEQAAATRKRVSMVGELQAAAEGADLVIEAVFEDLAVKKAVFAQLDRAAPAHAILCSNTSQLSITALAGATHRPERVVGTHWFSPVPVMRLIEVVRTDATTEATLATVLDFCRSVGKETVVCRDSPGFITSRAAGALLSECLRMLEEGVATPADIDKAMRLGFNHPMGPFEMADMGGLDVVNSAMRGLAEAFGERFGPQRALSDLVRQGHLGRKTGQGFYTYDR